MTCRRPHRQQSVDGFLWAWPSACIGLGVAASVAKAVTAVGHSPTSHAAQRPDIAAPSLQQAAAAAAAASIGTAAATSGLQAPHPPPPRPPPSPLPLPPSPFPPPAPMPPPSLNRPRPRPRPSPPAPRPPPPDCNEQHCTDVGNDCCAPHELNEKATLERADRRANGRQVLQLRGRGLQVLPAAAARAALAPPSSSVGHTRDTVQWCDHAFGRARDRRNHVDGQRQDGGDGDQGAQGGLPGHRHCHTTATTSACGGASLQLALQGT